MPPNRGRKGLLQATCVSSAYSRLLRGGDNCHGRTLRLQISEEPGWDHRMITLALAISWEVFLCRVIIHIHSNTVWWMGSANISPCAEHRKWNNAWSAMGKSNHLYRIWHVSLQCGVRAHRNLIKAQEPTPNVRSQGFLHKNVSFKLIKAPYF